jgi:hypothetical protein
VALTQEQQVTLERRLKTFDGYFAESMPVLADFFSRIGASDPVLVVNDPSSYLAVLDKWLAAAAFTRPISEQDTRWLVVRLGYFIGYVLTQRHGGCWFVDDQPESRWFLHYVVGNFRDYPNGRVDPNYIANEFLAHGERTSLSDFLRVVEADWPEN